MSPDPNTDSTVAEETLAGRRAVLGALEAGQPIRRLLLARGAHGEVIDSIRERARAAGVPFDMVDRVAIDRAAQGVKHQGVVAMLAARSYTEYGKLLQMENPFLVYLDGIQDPHNLGAIIRSAHAVGADGVVLPQRGGVSGVTAAVARASAGAVDRLPVSRVRNLRRALDEARESGIWITGLAAEGDREVADIDFQGNVGLVIGAEGSGLRRLVREGCDFVARLPMARPEAGSFNASVAAGIVLYEIFRQRQAPVDST